MANNNQPSNNQKAGAQAKAYKSAFAPTEMKLTYPDGAGEETILIPPHPNLRMLEDERLEAYEDLLFEAEQTYDREEDIYIPEQHLDNGVVVPATTRRGAIKIPQRITRKDPDSGEERTELVRPAWAVAVVIACLGQETYDKIRAAGQSASDVWRIWNDSSMELANRRDADPFPVPGRR